MSKRTMAIRTKIDEPTMNPVEIPVLGSQTTSFERPREDLLRRELSLSDLDGESGYAFAVKPLPSVRGSTKLSTPA